MTEVQGLELEAAVLQQGAVAAQESAPKAAALQQEAEAAVLRQRVAEALESAPKAAAMQQEV